MSQAQGMQLIQFDSTTAILILKEQINYLLSDVVGVGSDFFFFSQELYISISLILYHGKSFLSSVPTRLSIVVATCFESIVEISHSPEVL